MQASTSASRTSSILSGFMRIESAIAVAALLASISIPETIGSASSTSFRTPSAMSVPLRGAGRSKGEIELESVDHDGMDQVVRQQPTEAGQGAHREHHLDRNLRDGYVLPNGV